MRDPAALTSVYWTERRSPSLNATMSVVSAQVVEAPDTVHESEVLTPFLRIVTVAECPAPGATVRLTTSLPAVPDGIGMLPSASVPVVVFPHGTRNRPVPALA